MFCQPRFWKRTASVTAEEIEAETRRVRQIFDEIDEDHSGTLDQQELAQLSTRLGKVLTARPGPSA